MDAFIWSEIRRLYHIEKLSKSDIAGRIGVGRRTVRRALASEKAPLFIRSPRGSKLDPYKPMIEEILKDYPRLSGVRIYEKLQEVGYEGEITILRDYLRQVRGGKVLKAYLRVETAPAEYAQVDWASFGKIEVEGYLRPLSCFVMILSFSRMMYLEFTLSQKMDEFLRCHQEAFHYFGGCPRKILYDNLRSVVAARAGGQVKFNSRFMDFAGHYLFQPKVCTPKMANQKGKAENVIKHIKVNFFAGRYYRDFAHLKELARHWIDEVANKRVHGTTLERPVDRFLREKDKLISLPEVVYDTRAIETVRCGRDFRVKFDSNSYTVPYRLVGKNLTLKASLDTVEIYNEEKLVAQHRRSWGKGEVIEKKEHYEGLLGQRPRARWPKILEEFFRWGEIAQKYFEGLAVSGRNPHRHVARILWLSRHFSEKEVVSAMEHALNYKAFGHQYIHNIIIQMRNRQGESFPQTELIITNRPELERLSIDEPDLSEYNHIFRKEEEEDG